VLGLCSVIFDVDKGQTLQDLWPLDCLSEEDKAAVAFHAFPVSTSAHATHSLAEKQPWLSADTCWARSMYQC
jgi:hypothetical protein